MAIKTPSNADIIPKIQNLKVTLVSGQPFN